MEPLYAALVQRLMLWSAADLDELRQRWSSFNLDEYLGLPAGDPRRYSTYMSRHLGEPLQLPPETLHLPSGCLLYTSPSPRDATLSRMPSSA